MNSDTLSRILRTSTHKELIRQLNQTAPSQATQDWFYTVDPGTLIPSEDPEWKEKLLQCIAYSNLSLPKEKVLRYIPDLDLETWDVYAFYRTYKDTDIIEMAMSRLSDPEKIRHSANTLLQESIQDNEIHISKWVAAKYGECIPLLTEMYKNATNQKDTDRIQLLLDLGYIPPEHSTQRGPLHIYRLSYDSPLLDYYRCIEQEQMDYFIHIFPLRTSVVSVELANRVETAISQTTHHIIDTKDFFLVCVDGKRLCGSMFVETELDKGIYKIYLFATRSLMDPIYRGTGREMFQYLVQDAKRNGISQIQVVSSSRAIDFYRALGFQSQQFGDTVSQKMLYYDVSSV